MTRGKRGSDHSGFLRRRRERIAGHARRMLERGAAKRYSDPVCRAGILGQMIESELWLVAYPSFGA
jgi:hypothetical protein